MLVRLRYYEGLTTRRHDVWYSCAGWWLVSWLSLLQYRVVTDGGVNVQLLKWEVVIYSLSLLLRKRR
jgi:hypothetical protein